MPNASGEIFETIFPFIFMREKTITVRSAGRVIVGDTYDRNLSAFAKINKSHVAARHRTENNINIHVFFSAKRFAFFAEAPRI